MCTQTGGWRRCPGIVEVIAKCWPQTAQQRCWVHKTANVLEKLPKAMQPKVKGALHNIWQQKHVKKLMKHLLTV